MTEPLSAPDDERPSGPLGGRRRLAIAAIAAVAVAVVAGWLVLGRDDDRTAVTTGASEEQPAAASVGDLTALADELGHPVYWLGPRAGTTLELSRRAGDRVFVRYLPPGTEVGAASSQFTTVATYPVANAYATAIEGARNSGGTVTQLAGGGTLITYRDRPRSAYFVQPGSPVQVEVFDPQSGRAASLIRSGSLADVNGAAAAARPRQASAAQLAALPGQAGHAVYWAGPAPGQTYELTRTPGGRIYVRYLPAGVAIGDSRPNFRIVATYPSADAYDSAKREAERSGAATQPLADGGLLIVPTSQQTSVYLVWPDEDVQVEVFDPTPGRARELAAAGAIVPLG